MRTLPYRFAGAVPFLLIALLLGSCGPARNEFAPACPVPSVVKPLAELSRYRGPSLDIRDLVIRARIVDVAGKCRPGDKGFLDTTTQVLMEVRRGPGMEGLAYDLPLFVAVTDATAILDKKLYALRVVFERNQDVARAATPEIAMQLPVNPQKSGAAYGIIAGFQLTPEEVAAYRRNPHK